MPWSEYRVGTPSTRPDWVNQDCQAFSQVCHVTHIANALSIIPAGVINPQLVTDKSKLNKDRILVNWASPNDWNTVGYFYGNVRFAYEWRPLIAGQRFYWVEVMEEYKPPAPRILITDKNYDGHPDLIPYDPTVGDGPWWWDRKQDIHYRNGHINLELMLEFPLFVHDAASISTVKHSDKLCLVHGPTCRDFAMGQQEAAARFLSGVLGEGLQLTHAKIDADNLRDGWRLLNWGANGYHGAGGVDAANPAAPVLARCILSAYQERRTEDVRHLKSLFTDQTALKTTIKTLAEAKFPDIDRDLLDDL